MGGTCSFLRGPHWFAGRYRERLRLPPEDPELLREDPELPLRDPELPLLLRDGGE